MKYTAVHIPEFPAAAAMRELANGTAPTVILSGVPPQEKVVSLCRRAARAGLTHGMSKVQAEAACGCVFVRQSPSQEEHAFADLCDVVGTFSPRIQAVASPHNRYADATQLAALLLLDSSGMGALFGPDTTYATRLHDALMERRFFAGVAVAPNAEAAIMLARSSSRVIVTDEASIASDLARLSINLLPSEPRTKATLTRWGIRTLGQLASLPDEALVSRLGQGGRRLQMLARGRADHLLVPEEPALELSESTNFDAPVELLNSLLFVISPLLESVMRRAMEHAYSLRSIELSLRLEKDAAHMVRVQPATPSQNRDALLKLLNLELQANPPQAGILSVMLRADAAQPARAQRGLFQAQFPEPDRLDLLLARLRAIVGDGNVGSPMLLNTHQDDAFSVAGFKPSEMGASTLPKRSHGLALRLFRPHSPAHVTCWGDKPKLLFWKSTRRVVDSCVGPWHCSGSWWDRQTWDHDLWDVVTEEPNEALRLKHDHSSNAWSVMGVYD